MVEACRSILRAAHFERPSARGPARVAARRRSGLFAMVDLLARLLNPPTPCLTYRGCELFHSGLAEPDRPWCWEEIRGQGVSTDSFASIADAKADIDQYLG